MTTEIVRTSAPNQALSLAVMGPADAWRFAQSLAGAALLPPQYRDNPSSVLWALEYGRALGIDVVTAINSVHVINGRPTASADLIAGLVRKAGHRLRISGDDRRAIAVIIRADDPEFEYRVEWTWERAVTAKLTGKGTWQQFPAAMLRARAITEVARMACSEVLHGTIYTPEELGATVAEDGAPTHLQPVPNEPQVVRAKVADADVWETKARDYLHEAMQAATADEVRDIYRAAKADAAYPDYLEQIADVGRSKAAAPAVEVTDAEVVPEDADEVAVALGEVYDAAAALPIEKAVVDRDFEQSYGHPIADATVSELREMRDLFLGEAA